MAPRPLSGSRTLPQLRAAWQCSPDGFAAVAPVSGRTTVLATGSLDLPIGTREEDAGAGRSRRSVRSLLEDHALVEGHDASSLFERVNITLSVAGLGRLHSLALLNRAEDGVPLTLEGVGHPLPLAVTPDGVVAPAAPAIRLARGWTVVLGTGDDGSFGLVTPSDVRSALSLLDQIQAPGAPTSRRTLLCVRIAS